MSSPRSRISKCFLLLVERLSDTPRSVMTAKWVGDCFIYTTAGNRVNYFVGNESYTISPSDMYVLFGHALPLTDLVFSAPCTSSATYRPTIECISQIRT